MDAIFVDSSRRLQTYFDDDPDPDPALQNPQNFNIWTPPETPPHEPFPLMDREYRVVTTEDQVCDMIQYLLQPEVGEIGFHFERRSHPSQSYLCVILITCVAREYILDLATTMFTIRGLNLILGNPRIYKIVYLENVDLVWLVETYHLYMTNIFDVYGAAKVLSHSDYRISSLLEFYHGEATRIGLATHFEESDYRRRPMSPKDLKAAQFYIQSIFYISRRMRNVMMADWEAPCMGFYRSAKALITTREGEEKLRVFHNLLNNDCRDIYIHRPPDYATEGAVICTGRGKMINRRAQRMLTDLLRLRSLEARRLQLPRAGIIADDACFDMALTALAVPLNPDDMYQCLAAVGVPVERECLVKRLSRGLKKLALIHRSRTYHNDMDVGPQVDLAPVLPSVLKAAQAQATFRARELRANIEFVRFWGSVMVVAAVHLGIASAFMHFGLPPRWWMMLP